MNGYNQMNTGFEFMNNPIIPGQQNMQQNQPAYPVYTQPEQLPSYDINVSLNQNAALPSFGQRPTEEIAPLDKSIKPMFTIIDNDHPENTKYLSVGPKIPTTTEKKKRTRKPASEETGIAVQNPAEIVRADGNSSKELSTIYNYASTTAMLGETLTQVDMIAGELKDEFDAAKTNRTLKNKHNYIIGLAETMGQLLNTKASIIREINSSITKAIDLDYKKEKDRLAAEGAANDDKYLMDLYNAFISNPASSGNVNTIATPLMNTSLNSIDGNSIVRSELAKSHPAPDGIMDAGYLNYLSRISPEQNMMAYEKDPNVHTCVVYDASNGQKFFQVMNTMTGQVIPNVPVLDNRFLDDTVIDLANNIAKNNNLHETYPLVVINGNGGDNAIYKNY